MNYKKYTEANRKAWNEVTPKHEEIKREAKRKFMDPGFSCLDGTVTEKLQEIGLEGKDVAQVCCNDGVETLSLKNLGAASVTGFDISDAAIESGRRLAAESGIDCEFVRTDIYEIPEEYYGHYDLAYISVGALSWFPDLRLYFEVVGRLLKRGGTLLIYEMHPFLNMLDEDSNTFSIKHSYFIDEPWVYDDGILYMGNNPYESSTTYNFDHKVSDIFTGLLRGGFQIGAFEEFPHDLTPMFEHMEGRKIEVPMSMIIVAQS
ncbi:MAG TPA: class I SAM-dependent methyltransferase [Bacillales bacterium]|nr:class I SAM-dependent methyltransferase [Bacillales bacterium]